MRLAAWVAHLFSRRAEPPRLVHLSREGAPLCYSRGKRPRKGSGQTTDPLAVTCRRCIVAAMDAPPDLADLAGLTDVVRGSPKEDA